MRGCGWRVGCRYMPIFTEPDTVRDPGADDLKPNVYLAKFVEKVPLLSNALHKPKVPCRCAWPCFMRTPRADVTCFVVATAVDGGRQRWPAVPPVSQVQGRHAPGRGDGAAVCGREHLVGARPEDSEPEAQASHLQGMCFAQPTLPAMVQHSRAAVVCRCVWCPQVVPLSPQTGISQWVENTVTMGTYLTGTKGSPGAHARCVKVATAAMVCLALSLMCVFTPRRYGRDSMPHRTARRHLFKASERGPLACIKAYEMVCRSVHPVFHRFFLEFFPNPCDW